MRVRRLWLTDFRNYRELDLAFDEGLTAVVGANGQGKTNLVEALAYLSRLGSFRGTPTDMMIRSGTPHAVVRAEVLHDDGRELLIEAELPRNGRQRVQVNRQRITRNRDLLGVFRVTVFSPDDLELVKDGPGARRTFIDETLVNLNPRLDGLLTDLDRILKQRAALLKQLGGRLTAETEMTLDVWDTKLVEVGEQLGAERARVMALLEPLVMASYAALATRPATIVLTYAPEWRAEGLAAALRAARDGDLRRQITSVGPHRDDIGLWLNDLPARATASQGESRTLALALRLAAHELLRLEHRESPVLILDDVFSELDPHRSRALVDNLPLGQVLLTSASGLPPGVQPAKVVAVDGGVLR